MVVTCDQNLPGDINSVISEGDAGCHGKSVVGTDYGIGKFFSRRNVLREISGNCGVFPFCIVNIYQIAGSVFFLQIVSDGL